MSLKSQDLSLTLLTLSDVQQDGLEVPVCMLGTHSKVNCALTNTNSQKPNMTDQCLLVKYTSRQGEKANSAQNYYKI